MPKFWFTCCLQRLLDHINLPRDFKIVTMYLYTQKLTLYLGILRNIMENNMSNGQLI